MTKRDEMRAAIFSAENRKPKSKEVTFFGQKIEIRQPSVQQMLDMSSEENSQEGIVRVLVEYAYVPKTNDKVFEDADASQLKSMPFSKDFSRVVEAVKDLTDVDLTVEAEAKN